MDIRTITEIEL